MQLKPVVDQTDRFAKQYMQALFATLKRVYYIFTQTVWSKQLKKKGNKRGKGVWYNVTMTSQCVLADACQKLTFANNCLLASCSIYGTATLLRRFSGNWKPIGQQNDSYVMMPTEMLIVRCKHKNSHTHMCTHKHGTGTPAQKNMSTALVSKHMLKSVRTHMAM